jgi:hypothetical protein
MRAKRQPFANGSRCAERPEAHNNAGRSQLFAIRDR